MKKGLSISILVVLIIAVLTGVFVGSHHIAPQIITDSGKKFTYASKALGISFTYDASKASVQAQGNRITVYPKNTDATLGQKVTRFEKMPSETFEQSIQRQILAGDAKNNCTVHITQSNKYQGGYFQAEIGYPSATSGPSWTNAAVCNKDYDKTNGVRYFLYDSNHPDRFYFLDIGQYSIPATGQASWQDTIQVQ